MTTILCPTCQQKTRYDKTNAFRPFCTERCRLIDLGEWASGGHKIPSGLSEDDIFSEDMVSLINQGLKDN
ncbi:DNA gyrase inhibitor YacG [Reinekea sp.]|jgi:endogenous inhibitor of DNA gyrase (YacG/DUF329 family)|uniref:DNA gyrase inhibitor YacG n=1 Tax=Reinekea sp. TaxID=1970455 RepID=UPI002A8087B6|nr:DNA gyrase inhibitor YacG [Reinekea sp.]